MVHSLVGVRGGTGVVVWRAASCCLNCCGATVDISNATSTAHVFDLEGDSLSMECALESSLELTKDLVFGTRTQGVHSVGTDAYVAMVHLGEDGVDEALEGGTGDALSDGLLHAANVAKSSKAWSKSALGGDELALGDTGGRGRRGGRKGGGTSRGDPATIDGSLARDTGWRRTRRKAEGDGLDARRTVFAGGALGDGVAAAGTGLDVGLVVEVGVEGRGGRGRLVVVVRRGGVVVRVVRVVR